MRKIIVISMISLDGVLQGPGGPKEDKSNGFDYGGWTASYGDDVSNQIMQKEMEQSDYLLGRKTFDIWEDYWPKHAEIWPGINNGMKYVMSTTKNETDWQNTEFLSSVEKIQNLKNTEGRDLQVWGSSELIQTLLENDLVDELRLKIFPVTLGKGKKLFGNGTKPAAFKLIDGMVTPSGIVIANYERSGEIVFGVIGE